MFIGLRGLHNHKNWEIGFTGHDFRCFSYEPCRPPFSGPSLRSGPADGIFASRKEAVVPLKAGFEHPNTRFCFEAK